MKHYIKITLDELREFVTLPMERWESLIEIDRQAERNREKRREALMGRVVGLDD